MAKNQTKEKAPRLGDPGTVDRLDNVKKAAADAARSVNLLKEERKAINEDIAAKRANMEALGIPKAAFDMALRYAGWDPDKRKGFDLAYALVREAVGLPFNAQADLFEAAEKEGVDEETAAAAADRIWTDQDAAGAAH